MNRTLRLRRESLTELSPDDLAAVAAGDATLAECSREILDRLLHTRRPTQCLCP